MRDARRCDSERVFDALKDTRGKDERRTGEHARASALAREKEEKKRGKNVLRRRADVLLGGDGEVGASVDQIPRGVGGGDGGGGGGDAERWGRVRSVSTSVRTEHVPVHARIDRGWATAMCVEIRDGYRTCCCASARRAPTGNERTLDARSAGSLGHRARRVTRARAAGFARPHASTTRSPSPPRARSRRSSPHRGSSVQGDPEILVGPPRARTRDGVVAGVARRASPGRRAGRARARIRGDRPDPAPRRVPPVPPASASDGDAVSVPADVPSKLRGWALALALGRALPPAPPTPDGTTAPVAWHPHTPRLATVDRTGRVLIHADPAAPRARAPRRPRSATPPRRRASARVATQRRATLAVGGANGVCVWSHEAGARDGVGGVGGAPSRAGARIGGAPRWRLRRLCGDDDEVFGDADPFRLLSRADGVAARLVAILRGLAPNLPAPLARLLFHFVRRFVRRFVRTIRVPVVVALGAVRRAMRFRRAVASSSPARETARRCAVGTSPPIGASTSRPACPARRSSRGRRAGSISPPRTPDGDSRCGRRTRGRASRGPRTARSRRRRRGAAKRRRCGGVGHHARRRGTGSGGASSRRRALARREDPPGGITPPSAGRRRRRIRRRARRERRRHRGHVVGSLGETPGGGVRFHGGERCAREGTRRVIFRFEPRPWFPRRSSGTSPPRRRTPPPEGRADTARAATLSGPGGGIGEGADDVKGVEATTTLAVCWEGGVSVVPVFA